MSKNCKKLGRLSVLLTGDLQKLYACVLGFAISTYVNIILFKKLAFNDHNPYK